MMYQLLEFRGLKVRTVPPYFSVIKQHYKQEWKGLTLGDLLERGVWKSHQFGVQRALDTGMIKINNLPCTLETVVKPHDVLFQTMHRHEPPVLHVSAEEMIVYDDGDIVVINKPCTVPIHPSGAYNLNSVVEICKQELGMQIKPIHRLDRLVSGLVVFSRKSSTAKRLSLCLSQTHPGSIVKKSYLARVTGKFENEGNPWRLVSVGIFTVDVKTSTYECNDVMGKESQSRFALLSYCERTNTSLVQCEPLTGRTHQLRLHLQYIGHPIVNDPIYGPNGKLTLHVDTEEEQAYTKAATELDLPVTATAEYSAELAQEMLNACEGCRRTRRPPNPLGIWLHSMRFRVFERDELIYEFECPPPVWADQDEVRLLD
ncbi:hypothetical protein BASA81_001495 [Batrachochytrium salamandrivorans]|nr:hypothetical protein BASA81_001495 [Batrachochytrium salamandrivorans]